MNYKKRMVILALACAPLCGVLATNDTVTVEKPDRVIITETGGIIGIHKQNGSNSDVVMNSVGNTGNITIGKTGAVNNDRVGGIYGRFENANFTLNKVWSTGLITPARNADNTFNTGHTGVIGGSNSGSCVRSGDIILYGLQGL